MQCGSNASANVNYGYIEEAVLNEATETRLTMDQ